MLFVNGTSLYRKSCANCIKARAACDHNRPCSRCLTMKCVGIYNCEFLNFFLSLLSFLLFFFPFINFTLIVQI